MYLERQPIKTSEACQNDTTLTEVARHSSLPAAAFLNFFVKNRNELFCLKMDEDRIPAHLQLLMPAQHPQFERINRLVLDWINSFSNVSAGVLVATAVAVKFLNIAFSFVTEVDLVVAIHQFSVFRSQLGIRRGNLRGDGDNRSKGLRRLPTNPDHKQGVGIAKKMQF